MAQKDATWASTVWWEALNTLCCSFSVPDSVKLQAGTSYWPFSGNIPIPCQYSYSCIRKLKFHHCSNMHFFLKPELWMTVNFRLVSTRLVIFLSLNIAFFFILLLLGIYYQQLLLLSNAIFEPLIFWYFLLVCAAYWAAEHSPVCLLQFTIQIVTVCFDITNVVSRTRIIVRSQD